MNLLNLVSRIETDLSITSLATKRWPVLFWGEPGCGKSYVARAVHGALAGASTIRIVNCDCLSAEDAEAVLIAGRDADGLVPGALVDAANDGSVVLRGLESACSKVQWLVRNVLARKAVSLPGGAVIGLSGWIAATSRAHPSSFQCAELARLFRPVHVRPIRQRKNELPRIVREFLTREELGVTGVSNKALPLLREQGWPFNFYELESVLGRAAMEALRRGDTVIQRGDLERHLGTREGRLAA